MPATQPCRVLFVHNGAPGRFAHIARALLDRGWRGALIDGPTGTDIAGLDNRRFALNPPAVGLSFRPTQRVEQALLMGRGAGGRAAQCRRGRARSHHRPPQLGRNALSGLGVSRRAADPAGAVSRIATRLRLAR